MTKAKVLVSVLFLLLLAYLINIIYSNFTGLSNNGKGNRSYTETKDSLDKEKGRSYSHNAQVSQIKTTNSKPKVIKIVVDTDIQRVFIYDKESDALYKDFICSTGLDGENETVKGAFEIQDRGYSFFNPKYQDGAYYWVRFYKTYLFHSVPFDKNEKVIETEAAKLGEKASHGCIRLSMDDAKWFYDNIPRGTEVIVQ